jgi:hypothetical protein
METRINYDRAAQVLSVIYKNYESKSYPFNLPRANPPQIPENMPKRLKAGSVDHANFLFCLCYYMRGGIESDVACRRLSALYDDRPSLFDPVVARAIMPDEFMPILKDIGLTYKGKDVCRFWPENANRLHKQYNGNPVRIFEGVDSYEEACHRIIRNGDPEKGFFGFREKMVSMIIYYLMDAKFLSPFAFPVPVDIHVSRISIAHELVTAEGIRDENHFVKEVLDKIREMFMWFIAKHNADPLVLTNAVWLWSRLMCRNNPGNGSTISEKREGRKTKVDAHRLLWTSRQVKMWKKSCGSCDIRETCCHNIAAAEYHIQGRIACRSPREDPSNLLFSVKELANSNPAFAPAETIKKKSKEETPDLPHRQETLF